jgi:hypothetical protein
MNSEKLKKDHNQEVDAYKKKIKVLEENIKSLEILKESVEKNNKKLSERISFLDRVNLKICFELY